MGVRGAMAAPTDRLGGVAWEPAVCRVLKVAERRQLWRLSSQPTGAFPLPDVLLSAEHDERQVRKLRVLPNRYPGMAGIWSTQPLKQAFQLDGGLTAWCVGMGVGCQLIRPLLESQDAGPRQRPACVLHAESS